jgi:hypothetical protein
MEPDSDRRLVGGAEPLEPMLPPWDQDEIRRWKADPVWQATLIAPGAQLTSAAEVIQWPASRLTSWSDQADRQTVVSDVIPDDFDAYVRILFPFFSDELLDGKPVLYKLLTWNQTAIANGRQPHRLMDLVGIGPNHDDHLHGGTHAKMDLAAAQERALLRVLESHASSPRSWFLLWEGDYHGTVNLPDASLVEVDQGSSLRYCAFRGPHKAWSDFWSYPRWWWPEDRTWCWQTGLDLDMTNCAYLGGTHDCIEAILSNPVIEAVIAYPDDPTFTTDTINRSRS